MRNRFLARCSIALGAVVLVLLSFSEAPGGASTAAGADEPGPRGIVFVGSSIFHRWTNLSAQMAPLPVVNLAFDGAQTDDILRLADSRVLPSRPKVVAYYCGSNDVDAGEPAAAIFDRIKQFIDRVTGALPDTRVVFVSINRAPEKQDRWDVVDAINRQVEMYAAKIRQLDYVDVNPVLFNRDGTPRLELFMADRLHLRPPAYEEFARIIKPVLAKALAERTLR
jgi:lysophospholipase L1-like esterase